MSTTNLKELPGSGAYAFGPFLVDPLRRRLWRDRRPVPITSKTIDVLVVLLEHRGHVVSKDELLNRVWPNTAVNENNLARQVTNCGNVRLARDRNVSCSSGIPMGEPFPVTSFGSAQFQLTPRRVQMDIAVTATHLLLPLSESRSEIWMLDQIDR